MQEKEIKVMELEDLIFQCLHEKESAPSLIEVNQELDLFIQFSVVGNIRAGLGSVVSISLSYLFNFR